MVKDSGCQPVRAWMTAPEPMISELVMKRLLMKKEIEEDLHGNRHGL